MLGAHLPHLHRSDLLLHATCYTLHVTSDATIHDLPFYPPVYFVPYLFSLPFPFIPRCDIAFPMVFFSLLYRTLVIIDGSLVRFSCIEDTRFFFLLFGFFLESLRYFIDMAR